MSEAALREAALVTMRFGEHYMYCRQYSRNLHRLWFFVSPKVHKMQHLHQQSGLFNASKIACWSEDSLIGSCVRTWARSMSGRYKRDAAFNVLAKRVVALLVRLDY